MADLWVFQRASTNSISMFGTKRGFLTKKRTSVLAFVQLEKQLSQLRRTFAFTHSTPTSNLQTVVAGTISRSTLRWPLIILRHSSLLLSTRYARRKTRESGHTSVSRPTRTLLEPSCQNVRTPGWTAAVPAVAPKFLLAKRASRLLRNHPNLCQLCQEKVAIRWNS